MFFIIFKSPAMAKLVILLALGAAYLLAPTSAATDKVICYFASWTIYRPSAGKFSASDVDPNLCTHVMFAFVGLGPDNQVLILDDWEFNGLNEAGNLLNLREQNPDLKVMLSMGGWNEGSLKYSAMAKVPATRKIFVNSVVEFLDLYGFDGFDLGWEYPGQRDGDPKADPANYVKLLSELKAAFEPKKYLLSIAVAGAAASIDLSYDVPNVSDNVDFINVMAYDYHGSTDNVAGHNAPLSASHLDTNQELNVAAGVQHWLDEGADPSKIIVGVPTYGRCFTLVDPDDSTLYAPATYGCTSGPYTQEPGLLGYTEICSMDSDWEYVWDDEQMVPHKVGPDGEWVGYDDAKSVAGKAEFAVKNKLGGVMIWSLDTDDFSNLCGDGKYPLLQAINDALAK